MLVVCICFQGWPTGVLLPGETVSPAQHSWAARNSLSRVEAWSASLSVFPWTCEKDEDPQYSTCGFCTKSNPSAHFILASHANVLTKFQGLRGHSGCHDRHKSWLWSLFSSQHLSCSETVLTVHLPAMCVPCGMGCSYGVRLDPCLTESE